VVCPWLLRDLVQLGLWDEKMRNLIIAHNGSIQNVQGIPDEIKAIYKTVWEISQKKILDMAADRGAFICQSQSLNVHLAAPTTGQLTSMHFYGWKKGLKTGMYYLRTRPAAQAIQFTVDQAAAKAANTTPVTQPTPVLESVSPTSVTSSRSSVPSLVSSASSSRSSTEEPPSPTHSHYASPATKPIKTEDPAEALSLDKVAFDDAQKTGEIDAGYAAALARQKERELAEAKMFCSLENKEACLMCSG